MKKIIYFKEIGITMVALVISIIIILILAGVTLSTVTGENGLISKAKLAVEKYKESQMTEEESLKNLEENFKNFNFIESNKDVSEKEITTAQKEDVLEGKSYYTNEDELITGTMPKIESKNIELKSGEEYTIPLGYHDGTEIITSAKSDVNVIKKISNRSFSSISGGHHNVTISFTDVEDYQKLTKDNFYVYFSSVISMAEVNSAHVRTSSGASIVSYDYDSSKGILTITFNIYIGDNIKSCSAGYTIEALLIQ